MLIPLILKIPLFFWKLGLRLKLRITSAASPNKDIELRTISRRGRAHVSVSLFHVEFRIYYNVGSVLVVEQHR